MGHWVRLLDLESMYVLGQYHGKLGLVEWRWVVHIINVAVPLKLMVGMLKLGLSAPWPLAFFTFFKDKVF